MQKLYPHRRYTLNHDVPLGVYQDDNRTRHWVLSSNGKKVVVALDHDQGSQRYDCALLTEKAVTIADWYGEAELKLGCGASDRFRECVGIVRQSGTNLYLSARDIRSGYVELKLDLESCTMPNLRQWQSDTLYVPHWALEVGTQMGALTLFQSPIWPDNSAGV